MKKRLFNIRIIQGLLIVFLIGCLSQLASILIRCSRIQEVEATHSFSREIHTGPIPASISYNGNEYVLYRSSNSNKMPEIQKKQVGDVISKSAIGNNGETISINKIDGTSANIAVAINLIPEISLHNMYFNKDYIWYYQKSKFDIFALLSFIDIVAVILSYIKFIKQPKRKTRKLIYTGNIVLSLVVLEFTDVLPYVAMRTCSSIYMARNYPQYHFKIYKSEYYDSLNGYLVLFESDNNNDITTDIVISSKYFPISVVSDSMKSSD